MKPIRKSLLRPSNPDIKTQDFAEIQRKWYDILAKDHFPEIEDVSLPDRPLKKWSGLNGNNAAESDKTIHKDWPDNPYLPQQELLFHPELTAICTIICKHGNNSLTAELIKKILEMHIQGMNCRRIGEVLGISYVTVFRAQKKLIEWSRLIEMRDFE